jgi:hypothetical protein
MLTKNIDHMRLITKEHIALEQVIQGTYWDKENGQGCGQGCFIGCLTHSADAIQVTESFGIDRPLVLLLEVIFEGLDADDAKAFFGDVAEAIEVDGKDLSAIAQDFADDTLRVLGHHPIAPMVPHVTANDCAHTEGRRASSYTDGYETIGYAAGARRERKRQAAYIIKRLKEA